MPELDQAVTECDIFIESAFAAVHNTQIDAYNANVLRCTADVSQAPPAFLREHAGL